MSQTPHSMLYYATWKKWATVLLCVFSVLYAAPNLLPRSVSEELSAAAPSWLPVHPVNLGLDLQGGSYILLKVDMAAATKDRMSGLLDVVRQELQQRRIGYVGLEVQDKSISFTLRDPANAGDMREVSRKVDAQLSSDVKDGTAVTFSFSDVVMQKFTHDTLQKSIEIVRRRIDQTGTREPLIQSTGEDRILLQLPGVSDPGQIKRLLGQTAKLTFHLVDESATMAGGFQAPPGYISVPDNRDANRHYVIRRQPSLAGDTLLDAQASVTQQTGQPAVHFRFNTSGARRFGDITRENVGHMFAIMLDGKVITAPQIREPITGGQGQIDGNFTVEEATELAMLLRAGALPAPLTVIEERTVGPGLGQDAVNAGRMSGVIGLCLVLVFMFASYGRFGWYANFALLINVAMIFTGLNLLGATLTLPGIAGIVLTIGMAVDANVLIYERIREEMRQGRSVLSAIDTGYSRAMAAIVDSNVTTIISGIILFLIGTGPVRGFAVTLTLGIVTSMFSAIMITRLMVLRYIRVAKPTTLNL